MAKMTDAELSALVGRAYDVFQKLPNVHVVAVGGRIRGGRSTGELSLAVYVEHKLPRSQLGAGDVIPPEFEGLPTDVVESPRFVNLQAPLSHVPGIRFGSSYLNDTARYRPLRGGIAIQPTSTIPGRTSTGTLGFFARARVAGADRIMAVTCAHVVFPPKGDEAIEIEGHPLVGQPDNSGSCTKCCINTFGVCLENMRFFEPSADHYPGRDISFGSYPGMDVALVQVNPNNDWLAEIQGIGPVRGIAPVSTIDAKSHTYQVRKRGRMTGLTGGVVVATNGKGTSQSRPFTDVIIVCPNPHLHLPDDEETPGKPCGSRDTSQPPLAFSVGGDSGSAVVNEDNKIIGILFGGPPDPKPDEPPPATPRYGLVQPIESIIKRFGGPDVNITLRIATADSVGVVQHTAPSSSFTLPRALEPSPLQLRLEKDLARTERGRALTQMWLRHNAELNRLVNSNRRVAIGWHRSGGAALFQHMVRVADLCDFMIPQEVNGRPIEDCVAEVAATFARFGSPELRRDLELWYQLLPPLAGCNYEQLLASLSSDETKTQPT